MVTKEAADAMHMVIVVEEEVVIEMEEEAVAAKVNLRMVLVSVKFVCSILTKKVRNHRKKLGTKQYIILPELQQLKRGINDTNLTLNQK